MKPIYQVEDSTGKQFYLCDDCCHDPDFRKWYNPDTVQEVTPEEILRELDDETPNFSMDGVHCDLCDEPLGVGACPR
jgi:hypothetical protein